VRDDLHIQKTAGRTRSSWTTSLTRAIGLLPSDVQNVLSGLRFFYHSPEGAKRQTAYGSRVSLRDAEAARYLGGCECPL